MCTPKDPSLCRRNMNDIYFKNDTNVQWMVKKKKKKATYTYNTKQKETEKRQCHRGCVTDNDTLQIGFEKTCALSGLLGVQFGVDAACRDDQPKLITW